jgi:hypothetical protein
MNPRICICCGEPMSLKGNALSRNPNICASCSSLADGMDDTGVTGLTEAEPEQTAARPSPPQALSEPARLVVQSRLERGSGNWHN